MKIGWIVLTQIVLYTSSFAQATFAQSAPQEKWEGYKLVTDVDFQNENLDNFANNNVLQLTTVGSTNAYEVNATTNETRYNTFEIVNTEDQAAVANRSRLNRDHRAFQIETCRKQNLKKCPISVDAKIGTLFVNRGRYFTCRHSFHNWLYQASKENNRPINTISPPIILRKPRGDDPTKLQTVYNSAWPGEDLLQMSFIQPDDRTNIIYYEDQHDSLGTQVVPFDIVLMVRPLNLVMETRYNLTEASSSYPDNLRYKSEMYIMGYALATDYFPHGQGDAPGDRLVVSNGFISVNSLHANNAFFSTSNFITGGISGSPVVSADGTLIGVACRADKATTNEDVGSVGAWPIFINTVFLSSLWTSYGFPSGNVP